MWHEVSSHQPASDGPASTRTYGHSQVKAHNRRSTFCTAGLISGVPFRDMHYAMRHADTRTTMRFDLARANLDRHAAHPSLPSSPVWRWTDNHDQRGYCRLTPASPRVTQKSRCRATAHDAVPT